MKIRLSDDAIRDLEDGIDFYDRINPGLGAYFFDSVSADIDSLMLFAGVHASIDGWHYTVATRFPYVIWYGLDTGIVDVFAVLDGRKKPSDSEEELRWRRDRS